MIESRNPERFIFRSSVFYHEVQYEKKVKEIDPRRARMIQLMRGGLSASNVPKIMACSVNTVLHWFRLAEANGFDLEKCVNQRSPRSRTHNRTEETVEKRVLEARETLKDSILGEFGAVAIHEKMRALNEPVVPSVRTIGYIIARHNAQSRQKRNRQKSPPKAWYLQLAPNCDGEIDSVDFIERLKMKGPQNLAFILNIVAIHGGRLRTFAIRSMTGEGVVECLLTHWREHGLPRFVQFDNGAVFFGSRKVTCFSRVVRTCLQLDVTPVFAPPYSHGPQNAVEGMNFHWQKKVWERYEFSTIQEVQERADEYSLAWNGKKRIRTIPALPRHESRELQEPSWKPNLNTPLQGMVIYLRYSNDQAQVDIGPTFTLPNCYSNQLIRCDVDLTNASVCFYVLDCNEHTVTFIESQPYDVPQNAFASHHKQP